MEQDNAVPGAQAGGGTLTCTTLSVQLSGSGNGTFSWTGPNGFTSNDTEPDGNGSWYVCADGDGRERLHEHGEAVVELDECAPVHKLVVAP